MREILFRGKLKRDDELLKKGDWVYGSLLIIENRIMYIFRNKKDVIHERFSVIPETVGQYTGLMDKEGNRIFTCDLLQKEHNSLQRPQEEVFRVRELDVGGYVVENKNDFGYLYNHNDVSKVIGNIYDNPELLEKGLCAYEPVGAVPESFLIDSDVFERNMERLEEGSNEKIH